MNTDNSLTMDVRLADNVQYFLNKIQGTNEKDVMNEIISEFDSLLIEILTKKIGFTVPENDDFKLPFSTKIDLTASKGIIGTDLKRMLYIFNDLSANMNEEDENYLESSDNENQILELIKLCDNELFKLINIEKKLVAKMGMKESLTYLYSVIAAALVESLVS